MDLVKVSVLLQLQILVCVCKDRRQCFKVKIGAWASKTGGNVSKSHCLLHSLSASKSQAAVLQAPFSPMPSLAYLLMHRYFVHECTN